MYGLIGVFDLNIIQFLKTIFSLNFTPEEPIISPITKFHNLFKLFIDLIHILLDAFSTQSRILMKRNVNKSEAWYPHTSGLSDNGISSMWDLKSAICVQRGML